MIRAGVIGLGRHGLRHIEAYRRIEGAEIVAVCDTRSESVVRSRDLVPSAVGYDDWEVMLADAKLDILSVVTNGPTHAAITIEAAAHGIRAVFCEKPMATSVQDALRMIRACDESGTRLAICHSRRWASPYVKLRQMLRDGVIGEMRHMSFVCGGGLFAGNGSHMMDLARMLSGSEPASATGFMDRTGTPNPRGAEYRDPGALGVFLFTSGMRVVIDMKEDLGIPGITEIVGTVGRIRIDEGQADWKISARLDSDRDKPMANYWLPLHPIPFDGEALDMIGMLTAGIVELISEREISCTGTDGLMSLQMVLGAHVSGMRGGVPVALPLTGDALTLDVPFT